MTQVLHIAPTPFFADRGCHIRIEGIVRCLSELGFSNTVCTYHHGRDVSGVITQRISPIKNYTQTAAGPSKYKLWADWKLLWLVFNQTRRSRPAVIHAHLHEGLLIGLLVKLMLFWRRTPIIADMQGSLTGELDSYGVFNKVKPLKWLTHLFERCLLWFPNHIICSSQHSLEKLSSEFSIPPHKIALVQDGADQFDATGSNQAQQTRTEWQLPQDKVIAVYSGALLESKGLAELKQLIKLVSSSELHFLIVGYPEENLLSFLEDENLSNYCTLTGQVEFARLPALLNTCDIAIEPKNSAAGEGSGKMLNYLACGLPVVAFDTANNREFLPANIPLAATVSEMAAQLTSLVEQPQMRSAQAAAALRHFQDKFSWNITRQQLEKSYVSFASSFC